MINPQSVFLFTIDSCRYDTFMSASIPNLRAVAPVHMAQAPSHFTYGTHSAAFTGFTPGIASLRQPLLNPKFGKIFKLTGAAFPGKGGEGFLLQGPNIVEGFARAGYRTIGTGATAWFDPSTESAAVLTTPFHDFFYPGNTWSLRSQLEWIRERLAEVGDATPVFVFLNAGETHVPYYHEGASWSPSDNPCIPFQEVDRSADCAVRQRSALEFVDAEVAPLLEVFRGATTVIFSDHGDCWGEDGLWEHGISHPMTLTVPLQIRLRGVAVEAVAERPAFERSSTWDSIPDGEVETFLRRTEGMTTIDEAMTLYRVAREVREGCIVEVGAYRGRTTVALGRGSIDGARVPVFSIEPHAEFTGVLGGRFGPPDAGAFQRAMIDSGCYHVVHHVSLPSLQAAAGWSETIGLLWLDGDHRYEAVRADAEAWLRHVAEGALVIFDDTDREDLGPWRVVQELVERGELELVSVEGKMTFTRARRRRGGSSATPPRGWLRFLRSAMGRG